MQLRRVSKTYFSKTVLSIVVTILLVGGHVAGGTENENEDQKIDTFFNIYRHLVSRYKRDLENFDSPESNQTIYIIRQNPYLTTKEAISHGKSGKGYEQIPVVVPGHSQRDHPHPCHRTRGRKGSLTRCMRKYITKNKMPRLFPTDHPRDTSISSSQNSSTLSEDEIVNTIRISVLLPNKHFNRYDIRPDSLSQMESNNGTFAPYPSSYFDPQEVGKGRENSQNEKAEHQPENLRSLDPAKG